MKHRIALLVDGTSVSHPVKDLVDWIEAEPDLELCGLVVHPAPQTQVGGFEKLVHLARSQGVYTALSRTGFAVSSRLEAMLSRRYNSRLGTYDISEAAPHIQTRPIVSRSGFIYRFSDEDLVKVKNLNAQILIRCGNGILKGGILSAADHGVLSMHHGDNRVNRGGPAAFWEVLDRDPYTGFIVQRLTEELDGGEVLCRGRITTSPFYIANRVTLYERSNHYLKKTIRDVLTGDVRAEPPMIYDRRLYKTPLLHDTFRYAVRSAAFLAGKLIRKALRKSWRWGVGYTFGDWRSAVLWRGKAIPNPPGRFLADPFAFVHNGENFVFVEDYGYKDRKGIVSVYRIDEKPERLGPVLEEPFHLSFPFLFRLGGDIYMMPESSSNRDIRIYRAAEFPMKWELAKVAMTDVSAVDTIAFPRDGRWWMFSTIRPSQLGGNDAELHIFSAPTPLDAWQPHPMNPVVVDASRGRNAGLLKGEADTYRAAQRHAFGQYGAGLSIYRIDELNETNYAETHIQDIGPEFMPGIKGTHHLHHDGGLTVFDFVRDERA